MQNTRNILVVMILLLGFIGNLIYTHLTRPHFAYVRSEVLVNEFAGMQEARRVYQQKQQQWQANLDTLQADYRRKESAQAPPEQLQALARNIQQYTAFIEQLAQEEDQQMTQAVLEQINVFVEQYGRDHGYDLILGTTSSGSLLYGKEGMDITEELLEALNQHYNPGNYGE